MFIHKCEKSLLLLPKVHIKSSTGNSVQIFRLFLALHANYLSHSPLSFYRFSRAAPVLYSCDLISNKVTSSQWVRVFGTGRALLSTNSDGPEELIAAGHPGGQNYKGVLKVTRQIHRYFSNSVIIK